MKWMVIVKIKKIDNITLLGIIHDLQDKFSEKKWLPSF